MDPTQPDDASPVIHADDQLVEAIPNFSEGRRPEVVAAIVAAIQAPGVLLLNYSSDYDHNRSVVTIAGPPEAVVEGLFRAVTVAAQRIDLFRQEGAHPRLGATDVVPLVPLENISLADCVRLAEELGERIGRELALPVYLYEAAARRPERRNLADVRRGQFEGLVQEIHLPHRQPDFGPAQVGPAGAVIVGARSFLLAYNFFLSTGDRAIAKRIARQIRAANGGLPGVKALGLLVDGRAQVSVNLVETRQTSLAVLTERVAELARAQGTDLVEAELIGLMPQHVLLEAAAHYLKLPGLLSTQIVENAVEIARRRHERGGLDPV